MRNRFNGAIALTSLVALSGCANKTNDPAVVGTPERPVQVDQDLLSQIEQTAADLRALSDPNFGDADQPSSFDTTPAGAIARPLAANTSPTIEITQPERTPRSTPATDTVPSANTDTDTPHRTTVAEAARLLAQTLRNDPGADPVRVYAALAALEMIEPGVMVNPAAIEGLTPEDARVLEAWADLMRSADDGLTSQPGSARSLARAVLDAADTAESFEKLSITDTQLCSRVEGFGRFTPMNTTWLAGRAHRAIVYAEVDHFASAPTVSPAGDRGYEVRLTQELQLYHDNDGLLAWRMPPQSVVDDSRNKRRDFFVVQMIDLPANLSVGRYQLKVAIRDEISRQTSETVLPILIVADEDLIGPPTR